MGDFSRKEQEMTPFEIMVGTHLVSDFLFQRPFGDKTKSWLALILHSLSYTVAFIPIFLFILNIPLIWLSLLFFSHIVIDKKVLVGWWMTHVRLDKEGLDNTRVNLADQLFHLIVLAVIVFIEKGVIICGSC